MHAAGLQLVGTIGYFALFMAIAGSVASVIVRFRRSRGAERQQLKWLGSALILFAAVFVIGALTYREGEIRGWS